MAALPAARLGAPAPQEVAAEYEAGRGAAPFARVVVAGVADPPGAEELKAMVDEVLRGIAGGDFADVLHRAAAFAHVVAVGRAILTQRSDAPHEEVPRMLTLAEQLEAAARLEMRGELA